MKKNRSKKQSLKIESVKQTQNSIKPKYIQRCFWREGNPAPLGFDALVACDYMGSSEFEFGALPASLRRVTANLDQYVLVETPLIRPDGEKLWLLCKPENVSELNEILEVLKNQDQRKFWLEERMKLHEVLEGSSYRPPNLWWDIKNDWMCGFERARMEKLLKGLRALKAKWG